MTTNDDLYERGLRVIPGGVNSPVRAFRSVGGTPYFVASGMGSRVTDVEGNEFIDYVQSYGASILGHAHPAVVEAVQSAVTRGSTFGAPTEGEIHMAEELVARVPGMPTLPMDDAAAAVLQIATQAQPSGSRILLTTPNGWR